MGFLGSKVFFKHLLLVLAGYFGLAAVVYLSLSLYTLHGDNIKVPDLKTKRLADAERVLEDLGLEYVIVDSVFSEAAPKGSVLMQMPAPGFQVKKSRKIYLTMTSFYPAKINMPDLVDMSLRHAKNTLESYGLVLNNISYVPDVARDAVLEMKYKGNKIAPGIKINKGEKIDLVLGDGNKGVPVQIPLLIGLRRFEALRVLRGLNLSPGAQVFLPEVTDSMNAMVYRQIPICIQGETINKGGVVDLFFTSSSDKVQAARDSMSNGDGDVE